MNTSIKDKAIKRGADDFSKGIHDNPYLGLGGRMASAAAWWDKGQADAKKLIQLNAK